MKTKTWQEELKILIPEKTDNVIIHGYRQLTRGKIKHFISDLIAQTREETIRDVDKCVNDLMEYAKDNWDDQNTVNEAHFAIAQLNKLKK